MSLVKFSQGETFGQFPSLLDELFGSRFLEKVNAKASFPAVNVKESDDRFEVFLAAPGLKKDDFSISLENDVLTISTQKSQEKVDEKEHYTRKEYSFSSFSRSFNLPENADVNGIKAKYEDGELKLEIPKKTEVKHAVKQISIQ